MRPILVGTLFYLALTSGCTTLSDSQTHDEIYGEAFHADSCTVDGEVIGRNGYVLDLGTANVTFTNWVPKPGSTGQFIGFTATVGGGPSQLVYKVEAGDVKYISDDTTWLDPTRGSNPVTGVDFCECDNPDPDGDGSGGSNDGSEPIFL
jgi:hypothetical protein